MSDEEEGMPPFIRSIMEGMKGPTDKEKREMDAKNRQAHAATHGERNTCREAINVALDYLAQDLAGYLGHIVTDDFSQIDIMRDIRALMDKVRKNIRPSLVEEDGQITSRVFVKLRPWEESR